MTYDPNRQSQFSDAALMAQAKLSGGRYVVRYRDGRILRFDRELVARMVASAADYAQLWTVRDGRQQRLA